MRKKRRRVLSFLLSLVLMLNLCSGALAAGEMEKDKMTAGQQVVLNEDNSKTIITQKSAAERVVTQIDADGELDYTVTIADEGNIRTTVMVHGGYTIRSVSDTTKFTTKMYMKQTDAPDDTYELVVDITEEDIQQASRSEIMPRAGMTYSRHGIFFEYDYYAYDTGKRELYINHQAAVAQLGKFTSECNTFLSASQSADDGLADVISDLIGCIPVVGPFTSGCFNIVYTKATGGSNEDVIADLLVDYAWAWADEVAIKQIPGVSVIKASLSACKMIYYCNRVHTSWNTVKKG